MVKMKKLMMLMAAVAAAMPLLADEWTDSSTGYTWYYRTINGGTEAEICKTNEYGAADMAISSSSPIKAVVIPSFLGEKPVTRIGDYAFTGCSSMNSIEMPDSVTSIGAYAFYGCRMSSIHIPAGVTNIGPNAFLNCANLREVSIPAIFRDEVTEMFSSSPRLDISTIVYCSASIVHQVESYDGAYDGEGHGIAVEVAMPMNAVIKYALSEQGPYAEDAILFTNALAEAVTVWYTVEADDYVTVTNSGTVVIRQKALTGEMVTVADVSYTCDGTAKEPSVTVADGEPSIITQDDYDVSYANNVNAGTADVIVTGKRNYTGSVTNHFTIEARPTTTLGEYLNWPGQEFTMGGDAEWRRVTDVSHGDGFALRSGAVGNKQASIISTTVQGSGTISFWCRVSSEADEYEAFDGLMFSVDETDMMIELIGGDIGWTNLTFSVEGDGIHTLSWRYEKDKRDAVGEDCAWLDEVTWTPVDGLTAWLAERGLSKDDAMANGRTAAECYVLGLDPTDATNDFRIVSFSMVDGVPDVEWEPKTNRWTGAEINATLKGATNLCDRVWSAVRDASEEERAAFRFFKVEVEQER